MKKALFYTLIFLTIQFLAGALVAGIFALIYKDAIGMHSTAMQIVTMAVFSIVTITLFLWLRWSVVSKSYMRSRPWLVLFWSSMAAAGTDACMA